MDAEEISIAIAELNAEDPEAPNDVSDGYHTIGELYEFRKLYNAALFNEWAESGKVNVGKSRLHHDGEKPFGGGWFVVWAELPTGQITNHYELKDWDLFRLPEKEKAPEYDEHTSHDVLDRLRDFLEKEGNKHILEEE